MKDYFARPCTYTDEQFRRRFRVNREIFEDILEKVAAADPYFRKACLTMFYCTTAQCAVCLFVVTCYGNKQKKDCTYLDGLSPYQKLTAAFRVLAYGIAFDSQDEYVRMGASTTRESTFRFCENMIRIYGSSYLRMPNQIETEAILRENEARGFPGMLGSIDCMHWYWKNCPKAWAGQYLGKDGSPSVVLEVGNRATRDCAIKIKSVHRQLQRRIYGSGMPSSECRGRTTTSLSLRGHLL